MPSILFVCTANQCRSPMAMALMRKRLDDQGMMPEWVVESAGTWALDGISATDNAIEAMRERDLDLVPHLSRVVTKEMMASYDLILAMVSNHKEALQIEFPEHAHKVFLLSEMVGGDWDLEDPVGMPLEEYRDTANVISDALEEGWERIVELGSRGGRQVAHDVKIIRLNSSLFPGMLAAKVLLRKKSFIFIDN